MSLADWDGPFDYIVFADTIGYLEDIDPVMRTHPLAQFAPTVGSKFEEHMQEADVFVFDYTRSTTNWKALYTDRWIVLVDLGLYPYSDSVKTEIEKRCRIVRAHFDERGHAVVPPEDLEEAVLGSAPPPDPTWFRRQFLEPEYVN